MIVLTENNQTLNLEALPEEINDTRYAILDNSIPANPDFHFPPLVFLESFNSAALVCRIGKSIIKMPIDWQILIGEQEHGDLETIPLSALNDRGFNAFTFNPITSFSPKFMPIEIIDIYPDVTWFSPRLRNGQFLAIALTPGENPLCAYFVKDVSRNCEIVDYSAVW